MFILAMITIFIAIEEGELGNRAACGVAMGVSRVDVDETGIYPSPSAATTHGMY